jgi:hypothetical protein
VQEGGEAGQGDKEAADAQGRHACGEEEEEGEQAEKEVKEAAEEAAEDERPDLLEEEEEEELEDLSPAEKELDPLKDAKIKRVIDGKEYNGYVEDIEVGKISRERLYRIKYADGDLQHMTEQQVKEMQIHEKMLPVDGTFTMMSFLEDGLRIGKAKKGSTLKGKMQRGTKH